MGKRRKLRKLMRERELEDTPCVVICTGKKCADRDESREVAKAAREYAERCHPNVHVETTGCLHVCKDGPIAATYPRVRFKKHVGKRRIRRMIDKVA